MTPKLSKLRFLLLCLVLMAVPFALRVAACPFCSSIAPTFTEQVNKSDIVVLATLVKKPGEFDPNSDDIPKGTFSVLEILKGKEWVEKGYKIDTPIFGEYKEGDVFLIMGVEPPRTSWSTPLQASSRLIKYLHDISKLPESGPKRLVYFLDYLEDKESILAADAYDEFARASYEDVIAIKDSMDRDKLIKWLSDSDVLTVRKRLYYTLLGVCGSKADLPFLESVMSAEDRSKRQGLDSLIACYLSLAGEDGMAFVDKHFMANKDVDFSDAFSAVSALRFHGTETDKIPRKRIIESMRNSLDTILMADVVIPDLARWEDWSVADRLAKMFLECSKDDRFIRVPIASYMMVCPTDKAKKHMAKFREVDEESVKRAEILYGNALDSDWGDEDEEDSGTDQNGSDRSDKAVFEKSKGKDEVFEKNQETVNQKSKDENKGDDNKGKRQRENDTPTGDKSNPGLPNNHSDRQTVNKATLKLTDSTAFKLRGQKLEAPANVNTDPTVKSTHRKVSANSVKSEPGAPSTAGKSENSASNDAVAADLAPTIPSEALSAPISNAPEQGGNFVTFNGVSNLTDENDVIVRSDNTDTSLVAATTVSPSIVSVLLVPLLASGLIFLLCWSVLNGWFQRLIY